MNSLKKNIHKTSLKSKPNLNLKRIFKCLTWLLLFKEDANLTKSYRTEYQVTLPKDDCKGYLLFGFFLVKNDRNSLNSRKWVTWILKNTKKKEGKKDWKFLCTTYVFYNLLWQRHRFPRLLSLWVNNIFSRFSEVMTLTVICWILRTVAHSRSVRQHACLRQSQSRWNDRT